MAEKVVPAGGYDPPTFGLQNPWHGSEHGRNARFSGISRPLWTRNAGRFPAQKVQCAPRSKGYVVSMNCGARLSAHPDQVVEG